MKLVMTLRTRDQADIVGAVVAFHLNAGVDYVIATDHSSQDGTVEILQEYVRAGVLDLIHVQGEEIRGSEWRTRMARMAATGHDADWTFSCDGDEFFWPRGGSLADVLAAVPGRFGIVRAPWRFFLPRPQGDGLGFFAERMTARLSPRASPTHPHSPYKPNVKIIHRGDPTVVVQAGNHFLHKSSLETIPCWHPIEVLHFPTRTAEQLERKMGKWSRAGRNWRFERSDVTDARGAFESLAVDDDAVGAGLEAGTVVVDTRLRDALRALRSSSGNGAFLLPPESPPLTFVTPSPEEERSYRVVAAALGDRTLQRLQRRVDDLAARVVSREPSSPTPDTVG